MVEAVLPFPKPNNHNERHGPQQPELSLVSRLSKRSISSNDSKVRVSTYNPDNVILYCQDLSVSVKDKHTRSRKIVDRATLAIRSGTVTGVMGPTGCGKTTLFNAITKRLTKGVSGNIGFNRLDMTFDVSKYFVNYVMAVDRFHEFLTVEETLYHVAALRLPHKSTEEQKATTDALIERLGLTGCRRVFIGGTWRKGISKGQQKRVAIAAELIGDPSAIILDEPTSGLDSHLAFEILVLLKELAIERNIAILCSVHQPNMKCFKQFDNIILMSSGELCYNGPRLDIVPAITQAVNDAIIPPSTKLAVSNILNNAGEAVPDALLDVLGVLRPNDITELAAVHRGSESALRISLMIEEARTMDLKKFNMMDEIKDNQRWNHQFMSACRQSFKLAIRNPLTLILTIVVCVIQALLIGGIFFQLNEDIDHLTPNPFTKWALWDNPVFTYVIEGMDRGSDGLSRSGGLRQLMDVVESAIADPSLTANTFANEFGFDTIDPLRDMLVTGIDAIGTSVVFDVLDTPGMLNYISGVVGCVHNGFTSFNDHANDAWQAEWPTSSWETGTIMSNSPRNPDRPDTDPSTHTSLSVSPSPLGPRGAAHEGCMSNNFIPPPEGHYYPIDGLGDAAILDGGVWSLETSISNITKIVQMIDIATRGDIMQRLDQNIYWSLETNLFTEGMLGAAAWIYVFYSLECVLGVVLCCLGTPELFGMFGGKCDEEFPGHIWPEFPGFTNWNHNNLAYNDSVLQDSDVFEKWNQSLKFIQSKVDNLDPKVAQIVTTVNDNLRDVGSYLLENRSSIFEQLNSLGFVSSIDGKPVDRTTSLSAQHITEVGKWDIDVAAIAEELRTTAQQLFGGPTANEDVLVKMVNSAQKRQLGAGLGGLVTALADMILEADSVVADMWLNMSSYLNRMSDGTCTTSLCNMISSGVSASGTGINDIINTVLTVLNVSGALFFLVANLGFASYDVLLQFPRDRAVFNRERANGMWRTSSYLCGKMTGEVIFQAVPGLLWAITFYFMVGLDSSRFWNFIGVGILTTYSAYSMGYMVSALSPRMELAIIVAPMILLVMLVLSGFFLRDPMIPGWLRWARQLSLYRWSFFAVAMSEYPVGEATGSLPNEAILSLIGVTELRQAFCCVILVIMSVVFRVLSYVGLRHAYVKQGTQN